MISALVKSVLALVTTVVLAGIACAAEQAKAITIDEALKTAFERNPGLRVSQDKVGVARGKLDQAKSASRPQLGISGTWTQQGPVTTFTIPTPEGPQTFTLGQSRSRTASLNLTQPLDLAGQIRANRRMARLGLENALHDLERTANTLALDVYDAYYGVLRAKAAVKVAQEAVDAAKEHLRLAEVNFRAGTAPQFDVIRASVQVENMRQNLIQAQNAERLALANLANVLGLDPTTALDVVSQVEMPDPATRPVPSYEDALKKAYETRPEVQLAQEAVRISEHAVQAAKAQGRPDAAIIGAYTYTPDVTGFVAIKESWRVTASINIPLDTSGAVRAKVDEALTNLKAAQDTLTQTQQGIALEVRAALIDLQNALERRQVATANVAQAQEALRVAQVRFQAGVATGVEVTDAEVALTQARTNQVNADYDYLVALAKLDKATGALLGKVRALLGEDAK
ncbi:MAG: TolC family protein [Armatimonadota bacterium]